MAILWRPNILEVTTIHVNTNWQWVRVKVKHLHNTFSVFNVYDPNNTAQKKALWQSIEEDLKALGKEVAILGGDFNAILNPADKKGGKG